MANNSSKKDGSIVVKNKQDYLTIANFILRAVDPINNTYHKLYVHNHKMYGFNDTFMLGARISMNIPDGYYTFKVNKKTIVLTPTHDTSPNISRVFDLPNKSKVLIKEIFISDDDRWQSVALAARQIVLALWHAGIKDIFLNPEILKALRGNIWRLFVPDTENNIFFLSSKSMDITKEAFIAPVKADDYVAN